MKTHILTLLFLGCISTVFGQKIIEVSEDYSTVLIFPSQIDGNPILGNKEQYGTIEDSKGSANGKRTLEIGYAMANNVKKNTNLIVFTIDGYVYDFRLNYKKLPEQTTHFIKADEATRNIGSKRKQQNSRNTTVGNQVVSNPVSYYSEGITTKNGGKTVESVNLSQPQKDSIRITRIANKCRENPSVKKKLFNCFSKISNVRASLKQITYDEDELYFHIVLDNNGGQAYDVDFITTNLGTAIKEISTTQPIPITPLYIYNKPSRVEGNTEEHFIIVFEKFSINDKKELQIDIAEKEGERDLQLNVKNKFINNPVKL